MIFIIGTFWFWILLAVELVLLLIAVESEKPMFATVSLILTFLALGVLGNFNLLSALHNYPFQSVLAIISYFVCGSVWSFGKWWFYVKDKKSKRDQYLIDNVGATLAHIPPSLEKPTAERNQDRILLWMCYWPTSLVWTLLNDPVKKIFKELFLRLKELFNMISDHIYGE